MRVFLRNINKKKVLLSIRIMITNTCFSREKRNQEENPEREPLTGYATPMTLAHIRLKSPTMDCWAPLLQSQGSLHCSFETLLIIAGAALEIWCTLPALLPRQSQVLPRKEVDNPQPCCCGLVTSVRGLRIGIEKERVVVSKQSWKMYPPPPRQRYTSANSSITKKPS